MTSPATLENRFWTKVDKRGPDECWPWLGGLNQKGYGRILAGERQRPAQQVAWELANGTPFPDGTMGCHSCDNPSCVNPSHIWPGTNLDNVQDCQTKGRWRNYGAAHCKNGHEYTPENTGRRSRCNQADHRICLTCERKRLARPQPKVATLINAAQALLEASERHIFGDECLAERTALRAAIQTIKQPGRRNNAVSKAMGR